MQRIFSVLFKALFVLIILWLVVDSGYFPEIQIPKPLIEKIIITIVVIIVVIYLLLKLSFFAILIALAIGTYYLYDYLKDYEIALLPKQEYSSSQEKSNRENSSTDREFSKEDSSNSEDPPIRKLYKE